jgi:hypothetical protein
MLKKRCSFEVTISLSPSSIHTISISLVVKSYQVNKIIQWNIQSVKSCYGWFSAVRKKSLPQGIGNGCAVDWKGASREIFFYRRELGNGVHRLAKCQALAFSLPFGAYDF